MVPSPVASPVPNAPSISSARKSISSWARSDAPPSPPSMKPSYCRRASMTSRASLIKPLPVRALLHLHRRRDLYYRGEPTLHAFRIHRRPIGNLFHQRPPQLIAIGDQLVVGLGTRCVPLSERLFNRVLTL